MSQKHPFHLVDPSPWPLVTASAAFGTTTAGVLFMHGYNGGGSFFVFSLFFLVTSMFIWWRDVLREGTLEGQHTSIVQLGLRFGMILFIVSEIMFFFAFFWAFFWASLAPTPEIGSVWPPQGIEVLSAWEVPFLNTLILLSSGASVTWAHHSIVVGNRKEGIIALIITVLLASIFTGLQVFEYCGANFSISDGIYGSTFFMATGFHGFHVCIGTLFLGVCIIRLVNYHFTKQHHFGFEAAAWYWHFVDVVWLFLFVTIYWWGGALSFPFLLVFLHFIISLPFLLVFLHFIISLPFLLVFLHFIISLPFLHTHHHKFPLNFLHIFETSYIYLKLLTYI